MNRRFRSAAKFGACCYVPSTTIIFAWAVRCRIFFSSRYSCEFHQSFARCTLSNSSTTRRFGFDDHVSKHTRSVWVQDSAKKLCGRNSAASPHRIDAPRSAATQGDVEKEKCIDDRRLAFVNDWPRTVRSVHHEVGD